MRRGRRLAQPLRLQGQRSNDQSDESTHHAQRQLRRLFQSKSEEDVFGRGLNWNSWSFPSQGVNRIR